MDDLDSAENVRRHVQQAQKRGAEIWQDDRLTRLRRASEAPSSFSGPAATIFAIWWHHLTAAMYLDFGDLASLHPQMPAVADSRQFLVEFTVSLADPLLNQVAELNGIEVPKIAVVFEEDDDSEGLTRLATEREERDRMLRAAGWTVFSFSASEMQHSAEGCVREVMDAVKPVLEAFRHKALLEAFQALNAKTRAVGTS